MASALLFEPIITSPPDPRRFLRKGTGSLVTGAGSPPKQPPKSAGPRRVPDEDTVRPKPSRFRQLYQRCDLPIAVEQDHPGRIGLRWKQPVECVDVVSLLPLFLEGLIEEQEPYRTLAELGSAALIKQGGAALSDCVPQLILPLKTAIRGRRLRAVLSALCALRALAVSCPKTGRLILGFHRHLLPAMNQYILWAPGARTASTEESGTSPQAMHDAVLETLRVLDATGGKQALRSIQYFIPTYHRL